LKTKIDERISSIVLKKPESLLKEAILYSLFPGGKRIRPILCLLSCEAVSSNFDNALDVASAIELIHTYSLVHDDIMDCDETRRGKPSVYKKYGIPIAILTGDGLLTLAFEILSDYPLILKEIARAIGMDGMVLGQAGDVLQNTEHRAQNTEYRTQNTEFINLNKTAKLFSASCVSGGIIGGGTGEEIKALREFGLGFGLCFQLKDDLLDNKINPEDYKAKIPLLLRKTESSLSIFEEKGESLKGLLSYFKGMKNEKGNCSWF